MIVILLSGGLGQHDSFDMKPEAPDGIRGEFKPIDTAVPGSGCASTYLAWRLVPAGWRSSARWPIPGESPAGRPPRADGQVRILAGPVTSIA